MYVIFSAERRLNKNDVATKYFKQLIASSLKSKKLTVILK